MCYMMINAMDKNIARKGVGKEIVRKGDISSSHHFCGIPGISLIGWHGSYAHPLD